MLLVSSMAVFEIKTAPWSFNYARNQFFAVIWPKQNELVQLKNEYIMT